MLKITTREDTVKLSTLKVGDCFIWKNGLYRLCCYANGMGFIPKKGCSLVYNFTRNIVEYVGHSCDVKLVNLELNYA